MVCACNHVARKCRKLDFVLCLCVLFAIHFTSTIVESHLYQSQLCDFNINKGRYKLHVYIFHIFYKSTSFFNM